MERLKIDDIKNDLIKAYSQNWVCKRTRNNYARLATQLIKKESPRNKLSIGKYELVGSWIEEGEIGFSIFVNRGHPIPNWISHIFFINEYFMEYDLIFNQEEMAIDNRTYTLYSFQLLEPKCY